MFVVVFVRCMDHPQNRMALIGCGICTISGMFLKSSSEIQPAQLDPVDKPTTDSNHIILSNPRVLIGRGGKATKLH